MSNFKVGDTVEIISNTNSNINYYTNDSHYVGYQGIIIEEDVEIEYEMGTENVTAEYKIYTVDFTHFPNQPNILSQSKSSFYESRETTTEFNLKHI